MIAPFVDLLVTRKSALTINHPRRISIDFRVREIDEIVFRYSDYEKGYFIDGVIDWTSVLEVLTIAIEGDGLKERFQTAGFSFEYIED